MVSNGLTSAYTNVTSGSPEASGTSAVAALSFAASAVVSAAAVVAASVAAGTMIKNKISEKNKKNKKEKGLYYTVSLEDLYNSYDDKTLSEEEMINEIKKESSL